jgi:homoaconitase/3-isopropylmalate dehydratase large subunit
VFDEQTRRFLARRQSGEYTVWFSDRKAYYFRDYVLIISGLEPQIVPADNPRLSTNVANLELEDSVGTVVIGGASGGNIDALKEVADHLRKITHNVRSRLFVSPLDKESAIASVRKKLQIPILSCGGVILPPGLEPFGLRSFSMTDDAVLISTPLEPFEPKAERHYLVNHQTAAATAVAGKLTCP